MEQTVELKVKYIGDIPKLSKFEIGDWIDLRSAEDVTLSKEEFKLIKLGIAIALPEGYEAYLAPRSSTFKNFGILQTNSVGVIDCSYRGEWMMPVYATRDTEIHKGDRIAQFRIEKNQPKIKFTEVEEFADETQRSSGGFGSTGIE